MSMCTSDVFAIIGDGASRGYVAGDIHGATCAAGYCKTISASDKTIYRQITVHCGVAIVYH